MLGRQLLLALGAVTLVAGLVLTFLWIRTPPLQVEAAAPVPRESVLVVTRTIRARSLLRIDDLGWTTRSGTDIPAGSFARGQASPADFAGAVVRQDLRPGDVLKADEVVKANEPGFLPAVLAPGMRATSIAVSATEGTSGLIVPGDHVDVVLTQAIAEPGTPLSHRSVGETVLSDLRVIAIDQTTSTEPKSKVGELHVIAGAEPHVAKTVTLEVTVSQAEALMVALQLGKIQLTLRNATDESDARTQRAFEPLPTWGSDVSPALRSMDGAPALASGQQLAPAPATRTTLPVEVMHGDKNETRCFDRSGRPASDCTVVIPPPAPTPQSGPAVAAPPVLSNHNL